MSEKPEALRLADALDISSNHGVRREAAAELRRLHAEAADFHMAYRLKCDEETKVQAVQIERLRADLATLRAQNYETQSLLAGAENDSNVWAERFRKAAIDRDALKRRLQLHDACNGVMAERGYVPECISLRSDIATLRGQNYQTQSLLAGAEAECDALRADLAAMTKRAEAFEKALAPLVDLEGEYDDVEAERDALRAELTSIGDLDKRHAIARESGLAEWADWAQNRARHAALKEAK